MDISKPSQTQPERVNSMNLIKPYFLEQRWTIVIGLAALILVDMLQLVIPRIIKRAIDDMTALRIDADGLLRYGLYITGIALVIAVFRYVWRHCLIGMSRRVEEGLRNQLFEHVQLLSAPYFNRVKTGDLMAHATNDIQHIRMASGMGVVALTDGVVMSTAAIGFMAYISVRLTALVLIPMPLIIFGARFFTKRMHRQYQEVQASFSDLTEAVRERFTGIRIIKAYNREAESASETDRISQAYIRKNLNLVKITGSFFPMMMFFSNISLLIVLYIGGRETILMTITPGDFVAFISYLGLLTWPMMAVGWVTNLIQRGKASLDRINVILQTEPEIRDAPHPLRIQQMSESVTFENVSFSYQPGAARILSEICLELRHGQTLGIVGPPGAGKTTLISLIPRIYDASEGCIRIDGADIRTVSLHDLRSLIAFVPQEPFLFAGTIRDNMAFGNPDVTESDLIRASQSASVYETIQSFPHGFDTVVGEKGILLSGGQKQRIALARALLKDSPVLILDDPVSQVDMETGNAIIHTLRSLSGGRIIIIVSHRLSALKFADRIITLDNGRLTESGTHEELMKTDTYYAKTFRLQEIVEAY